MIGIFKFLTKPAASGVATFILGASVAVGVVRLTQPTIEINPTPSCPEQKPCQGIELDKVKGRNVTIEVQQYLTTSGDSTIRSIIREELTKLKISKCR